MPHLGARGCIDLRLRRAGATSHSGPAPTTHTGTPTTPRCPPTPPTD